MDGDDGMSATKERSSNGSGRLSLSKRHGQGHNRSWARVSLSGLTLGRRRDKEPKGLTSRSPSRRMTLGGAIREEGVGAGGAAFHGRHGIRYQHAHSDSWVEELKQEEAPCDTGEDRQAPLPTSSSTGQLAALRGAGQQHETIAEEDGGAEDEGEEGEGDGADAEAGEKKDGADDNAGKTSRDPTRTHRRDSSSRRSLLMSIHVDSGLEPGGGGGRGGMTGQVSPASEARRGSMSPGFPGGHSPRRQRTQSWAPAVSPPVLSGPFTRTRSRSRSPRQRLSIGGPSFDTFPRLQGDLGRFSSTGGGERATTLSKEPSVSTAEDGTAWSEGEGGGAASVSEDRKVGPFTDSALVMARLRLPNMDLGFEEDGFFGIDVRSLIIGKEIARGAYGVVHEGTLLQQRSKDEAAEDGDQSGSPLEAGAIATEEVRKDASTVPKGDAGMSGPSTAAGKGKEEDGDAGEGQSVAQAEGVDNAEGKEEDGADNARRKGEGTRVAVKIQQVPVDEEEQANLLGELGVLRNHKHPHLVEFIGTAMAMERGADTVMVAMELCTNGALREALKLNISWPLKARIALDMTDGLQYLHQHGIIHRDIKTPNVLIDGSWRAKLCDYNFAIDEDSSIKQEFCAGTAEFMSPEVLLSEEYGLPSDIFSLGMIFVEMLSGKEPSASFPERPPQAFFVVSEEEIEEQLLPDCPTSFSLLRSQCLFSEPAERPTAEDAFLWLQELVNEMGEDNILLPQSGPPLPVLTEGAAIAREGNVINASPKGTEHHWFDSDAMEDQIGTMVENAVGRALAERGQDVGLLGGGGDESEERLDAMKEEMEALRAACDERDSRISDLEVQALRNTSTLKMLSSALEVAYKMLEAQQAALSQPTWSASLGGGAQEEESAGRASLSGQDSEDFDAVEARLSQVGSNS